MKSGHKSLFQRAASGRIVGCGTDGLRNATAQQHADFWYEYQGCVGRLRRPNQTDSVRHCRLHTAGGGLDAADAECGE